MTGAKIGLRANGGKGIAKKIVRAALVTAWQGAADEGRQPPVRFKLGEPLRLTDVRGAEWLVRFVEMTGNSSVLEYEPPPRRPR